MMSKVVELKVPYQPAALKCAADFFAALADAATAPQATKSVTVGTEGLAPAVEAVIEDTVADVATTTAAAAFGLASDQAEVDAASNEEHIAAGAPDQVDPATLTTGASGVPLADGLPWDARIHGSGKTTYAKAPHGWKYKRGVSPELIAEVEAELRQAMAIPGPGAATTPTPTEQAPPFPKPEYEAATPGPTPPETTPDTAAASPAVGPITNFAELNMAITTHQVSLDAVTEACKAVQIPSYPLLATRADLIPAVAALLFPEGA